MKIRHRLRFDGSHALELQGTDQEIKMEFSHPWAVRSSLKRATYLYLEHFGRMISRR